MKESLTYHIHPKFPEKHIFEVECHIPKPLANGQRISIPAWIPGSYLIRDFSKHIVEIRAEAQAKALPLKMLDKNTWMVESTLAPLIIYYQVYAYDLVPRGAHLDTTHAFLSGSRLFLKVEGYDNSPCKVLFKPPQEDRYKNWRLATTLTPDKDVKPYGFGYYSAQSYDDLIDHPVEMGEFILKSFVANRIPHDIVLSGFYRSVDFDRLTTDLAKLCEYHIQFFGPPFPMERFLFLLNSFDEGGGGIEHRSSCVAHCKPENLPNPKDSTPNERYIGLLILLSHEYFHTWNVKRIKPKVFSPYDLTKENYTKQLWIFEGITSYYDELALIRTKLISKERYLELLSLNITGVLGTPGRLKQTLEQSSFEAWTKYYQPNENSPNATINYYTKGALVGLLLDLLIRQRSNHNSNLDEVMKAAWLKYGITNIGVEEGAFEALVEDVTQCSLQDFFDLALRSTEELALEPLLENFGIKIQTHSISTVEELTGKPSDKLINPNPTPFLGIKMKPKEKEIVLAYVYSDESAEKAGLASGDTIIAIEGFRVDRNNLDSLLAQYTVGDEIEIHAFRRGALMTFKVKLEASKLKNAVLSYNEAATETQKENLKKWLFL